MRDASWAELAPRPFAGSGCWVPNVSLQRWHRKMMQGKKQLQKEDTRGHAAPSSLPVRAPAHACACVARSHPTLPRAALSPWQPRLGSGERAGWARTGGICGTGRDGTGRAAAAEVAGLKGSSGFSPSSSDRFGPEGLVHRHGLAESKRGRSAGPRGWAGRAGLGGGGRGRALDPPDPTRSDPTRADLSARRERWPRPGPRMTCLALGRDCGAETGSRTRVPEPLRRR